MNNPKNGNQYNDINNTILLIINNNNNIIYNEIWEQNEAVDVCCDLDEIMVPSQRQKQNIIQIYKCSCPTCDKKKVIANEPKVFFNHFNRKPKVEKKENDIKFEEPEIHENIKVLNPVLYMFKYFKPSYFNVKKIQCSYNKNSLSIMNVTMGEYEIPKIKQNLEYVTPSGDIVNFPEKIKEAILEKAKKESNKWIKSNDDPYINVGR
ncbi:hypothetical protein PFLG_03122 [Plasmodium falciparum RAJ116]|uniref:Uncharacterized protein n=1 Tax=Plasmodium falciparum RAJ116 TaxID=580058 RepID=A0A0L0D0D5_PLAFA|nr:hypothetical protein PFLG_03122 [Plasmodium falciparum RAJ116]